MSHICSRLLSFFNFLILYASQLENFDAGFLEKEIKKDNIHMLDTGENPDVPQSREMIDLEVVRLR